MLLVHTQIIIKQTIRFAKLAQKIALNVPVGLHVQNAQHHQIIIYMGRIALRNVLLVLILKVGMQIINYA